MCTSVIKNANGSDGCITRWRGPVPVGKVNFGTESSSGVSFSLRPGLHVY